MKITQRETRGLNWFVREMEKKLEANFYKREWCFCSLQYLSMRLTQEKKELARAIKKKDKKRIIEECADVANFAMMIADNTHHEIEEEVKEVGG